MGRSNQLLLTFSDVTLWKDLIIYFQSRSGGCALPGNSDHVYIMLPYFFVYTASAVGDCHEQPDLCL